MCVKPISGHGEPINAHGELKSSGRELEEQSLLTDEMNSTTQLSGIVSSIKETSSMERITLYNLNKLATGD